MRRIALSLILAGVSLAAQADGLQQLERFLQEVRTARAEFTQVVTSPKRTGESVARSKTSYGRFEFQRPGRFRFDYTRPFEQTIVADGETLWLHDVDLDQVTARRQQEALGSTPAALIVSGTSLEELGRHFELQSAGQADGLEWVQARPRQGDGQLLQVRVGLRQGELARLEIDDSLGQRSVLSFTGWQANVPVPSSRFRFQPPPGVAVIRP
ncbi:MAG: outer membrane lipoprotein chaperone LolA [Burkholderiales bacterium]|nr:MAG: outer membrane lipoprotein chaperone LolA [Burkholderiales bacterium]